ncbi:MAG TPA: hypothetical protein VJQ47_05670 [Steroidobacteraceae bacterium]|nr:hypothetical protein [Steroidobacteraceae bacterium]
MAAVIDMGTSLMCSFCLRAVTTMSSMSVGAALAPAAAGAGSDWRSAVWAKAPHGHATALIDTRNQVRSLMSYLPLLSDRSFCEAKLIVVAGFY